MSSPMVQTTEAEARSTSGLTIFALPKAFRGHIGVIQRNAILSWTHLRPTPEIILLGDDEGAAEIAHELGLRYIANIARNEFGTPLVSDLFQQAQAAAPHDMLCYVNSDIILLDDFTRAVQQVASSRDRFLMVGRRLDLDVRDAVAFESGWESSLRSTALRDGRMNVARSIDYFVFPRTLYPALPPMAIGRFWWDNWLIWKAYQLQAAVVDATPVVLAIHQNHDYSHSRDGHGKDDVLAGEEAARNCRLGCETNPADFNNGLYWRYFYTIDDASHVLTPTGLKLTHRHAWKMVKRGLAHPLSLPRLMRSVLPRSQ